MRFLTIVAALLTLSSPAVFAQMPDPALQKALEARDAARRGGDEQTWGRYTTDDFIVVNSDGQTRTKMQRMAEIKGNKVTTPQPKTSDVRVRVYGDTVIRTTRNESQTGGQRLVEMWVRQGGQWRVAHVQFTPIPK